MGCLPPGVGAEDARAQQRADQPRGVIMAMAAATSIQLRRKSDQVPVGERSKAKNNKHLILACQKCPGD